jgi:hypothetical protein
MINNEDTSLDMSDLEHGSAEDENDSPVPDLLSRTHYDSDLDSDDNKYLDTDFSNELDGEADNEPVVSLVTAPNTSSRAPQINFANSLAAIPNLKTRFANANPYHRDDQFDSHHMRRELAAAITESTPGEPGTDPLPFLPEPQRLSETLKLPLTIAVTFTNTMTLISHQMDVPDGVLSRSCPPKYVLR